MQNNNTSNNNPSNFADHHEKSLDDKEMDALLVEVNKKIIGVNIRRHNKEKKLHRERMVSLILCMYQNC